ncbi:hypothetical protein EDB86DRAFT_2916177 [Lactarius hatsudake]|nr:hypothetical protein EDB86DRAFT_2916177 [Lactarius hatsudake]
MSSAPMALPSLLPASLPCFVLLASSYSCPACHSGLMPVRASPPPHHLSLPHVSPAGYGAARALNKKAWPLPQLTD